MIVANYNAKNYPSFEDLGGEFDEDTVAKMVQIDEARKEKLVRLRSSQVLGRNNLPFNVSQ